MLHKIVNFLQMISLQNKGFLLIYAYLFLLIFISGYLIIGYEQKHNRFEKLAARWKANLAEQEHLREEEYQKQLELDGEFKDKNRLRKISKKIQSSGLKNIFPELTAEVYLIAVILISVIAAIFAYIWTGAMIMAIVSFFVAIVIIHIWIEVKITQNYIAIEKEAIKFINILENMSYSEGNIAEILGATVPYLTDPLRSSVEKCYYEIKSTGDVSTSLQNLVERTNYRKLREVFESLRICSTHNEDYESVISESRESIRTYIAFRKANTRIKMQSLIDMSIMGILGIVIIFILSSMIDNVQKLLFQTLGGQALLTTAVVIFLYGIWSVLKTDE